MTYVTKVSRSNNVAVQRNAPAVEPMLVIVTVVACGYYLSAVVSTRRQLDIQLEVEINSKWKVLSRFYVDVIQRKKDLRLLDVVV